MTHKMKKPLRRLDMAVEAIGGEAEAVRLLQDYAFNRIEHDILSRLEDLLKQATTDRSHYYTASVVRAAIAEIKLLRRRVDVLQAER